MICDLYYVSFISRSFSFEFPETKTHVRERKRRLIQKRVFIPVCYLTDETDRSPHPVWEKIIALTKYFRSLLSTLWSIAFSNTFRLQHSYPFLLLQYLVYIYIFF